MKRRPPQIGVEGLPLPMVEWLLLGQSPSDPFLEFELVDGEAETAWRTHRDAIRREAARRGITAWGERFEDMED
jgi:hypothetical protein